jgi:hypothetical protein
LNFQLASSKHIEAGSYGGRENSRVSWNEMPKALAVYAANRQERTARMLLTNRENTWLRFKTDTDWVYNFDAWHTELAGLENAVRPSV